MIRGVSPYVPYSHYFEVVPICPQHVVTSCPHQSTLSHLRPLPHVLETPELPEVVDKVYQPKIHQQIRDLLTSRVLGLADVRVEVP